MTNTTTRSATTLVLLAALMAFAGCDRRTGDGTAGSGAGAGTGAPGNSTSLPPAAPAPDMAASPASR